MLSLCKLFLTGRKTNERENQEAVRDARQLGIPKMLILGIQHMFAMFGATILVPILVAGYFQNAVANQ